MYPYQKSGLQVAKNVVNINQRSYWQGNVLFGSVNLIKNIWPILKADCQRRKGDKFEHNSEPILRTINSDNLSNFEQNEIVEVRVDLKWKA